MARVRTVHLDGGDIYEASFALQHRREHRFRERHLSRPVARCGCGCAHSPCTAHDGSALEVRMRRLWIRCARYRPDVVDLHNALVDGYGRVLSPAATEAALRNSLERTRQKHLVSGKELYLREETPALLTSTSTCATGERGGPGPDGPASHGGSTRLRKA